MSGHWPPEWEDPDDGHSDAGLPDGPHPDAGHSDTGLPDGEHPDAGHSDLDLSEVTSFLASVHSPALPASFEARIGAAIAAEAAARATTGSAAATEHAGAPIAAAGAGDAKGTVRSDNPEEFSPIGAAGDSPISTNRRLRRIYQASRSAPGAAGPGHSRPDGRRRRLRKPFAQASGWLVVCCLVIAGFGYLFTHASGSSSSSIAASSSSSSAGSAAAGAAVPAASSGAKGINEHTYSGLEPQPASSASASASGPIGFTVIESGTRYQRSTLAGQVRKVLSVHDFGFGALATPSATTQGSVPSAASSAPASGSSGVRSHAPSAALSECVAELTGEVTPSLVDQASYDGTPAYIIAVPGQVWVVGLGCSATDTDVIARVPLTG